MNHQERTDAVKEHFAPWAGWETTLGQGGKEVYHPATIPGIHIAPTHDLCSVAFCMLAKCSGRGIYIDINYESNKVWYPCEDSQSGVSGIAFDPCDLYSLRDAIVDACLAAVKAEEETE